MSIEKDINGIPRWKQVGMKAMRFAFFFLIRKLCRVLNDDVIKPFLDAM